MMDIRNKPVIQRQDYISELSKELQYSCLITLPETIYEGSRWIKFKKPLILDCFHVGKEDFGYKCATYEFDFGMQNTVALEKQHNFILAHSDDLLDEEKIAFDIIFDLFHAFFHPSVDPNYTDFHWALYGNLKDRVETGEDEE